MLASGDCEMNSEKPIEVNVDLPLRDLYRASISIIAYALRYVTAFVILVTAACLFCLLYTSLGFPRNEWVDSIGETLLPFLVTVPIVVLAIFVVPYFRARNMLRAEGMNGRRRYIFSTEEVTVESPLANAIVKWPAYRRVQETSSYFLLYSASNFANVIPKRCFGSKADISSFRSLVRQQVPKVKLRHD